MTDDEAPFDDPPRPAATLPGQAFALLGAATGLGLAAVLRAAGLTLVDAEPAPKQTPPDMGERHHFGIHAARTGDLGSLRQVLQLVGAAQTGAMPQNWIWSRDDGRLVDGLRPLVDPHGFAGPDEMTACRRAHLAALRQALSQTDVLILVLSESACLIDAADGTAYPAADPKLRAPQTARLAVQGFGLPEMEQDFLALRSALQAIRPGLRLRLVVSPLPAQPHPADWRNIPDRRFAALQAQASLRSLAADWAERFADVSYAPYWDFCIGLLTQDGGFDPQTGRLVPQALALVAGILEPLIAATATATDDPPVIDAATARTPDDKQKRRERRKAKGTGRKSGAVVCEEELLEAFAR